MNWIIYFSMICVVGLPPSVCSVSYRQKSTPFCMVVNGWCGGFAVRVVDV